MGYHRAPGMSSSFISLSHFLYRNPEDPAKTACLCWQPFNNTVVVVSPRIFCHLALRCAKLNWEKTKPLYDSFHVQIFFFPLGTEMCLSAMLDQGKNHCLCQCWNLWVQGQNLSYVHFTFYYSYLHSLYLCGKIPGIPPIPLTLAPAIFESCDGHIVTTPVQTTQQSCHLKKSAYL